MINKTTNPQINFTARINDYRYDFYRENQNCNGRKPDRFILNRINQEKELDVFEIGAGQGRNTIPVSKNVRLVTACEINQAGRECIKKRSLFQKIKNIEIINHNILDPVKTAKKYDSVYMSHISQHFNNSELAKVFDNAKTLLKENGEFVFDALIRQKKDYKRYNSVPLCLNGRHQTLETYGAASFKKEDILNIAKGKGFILIEESPFKEGRMGRAWYERQRLWGGNRLTDIFYRIQKRPVKLTWLVFKKL